MGEPERVERRLRNAVLNGVVGSAGILVVGGVTWNVLMVDRPPVSTEEYVFLTSFAVVFGLWTAWREYRRSEASDPGPPPPASQS